MSSNANVQRNYFNPLKVFISYSHTDAEIKAEIERSLLSMKTEVVVLSDSLLKPGKLWEKELEMMRNEADVFLLLVSNAYLQSATIQRMELPQIIQKGKNESKYVIPVILEKSDWLQSEIGIFQSLQPNATPLNETNSREEVYTILKNTLEQVSNLRENLKVVEILKRAKETQDKNLDLSRCELLSIPHDLFSMPWLETIDLSYNQVQKISNLQNQVNLKTILLSYNRITKIENIETLENLEFLDLENNLLTEISGLAKNKNLQKIGLSSNSIKSVSGLSHLKKLRILYLAHNQLEDISELAKMPQLKRIILTNNKIISVKPLLSRIRQGLRIAWEYSFNETDEGLFIKDNMSLSEPSVEVVMGGQEAVLKYFKDATAYGTKKLEVIKFILVGNSGVGKTNLSEFLRGLPLTKDHHSTHLLDIQKMDAKFLMSKSGEPMRINIFDFGGQDYYHDSHRMYYSHDTVYILMWEKNTNKYSEIQEKIPGNSGAITYENFPLEYWLESIKYNLSGKYDPQYAREKRNTTKDKPTANTSPVFILQNKIEDGEHMLDQRTLCKKYQNISGFYNISLQPPKRTEILLNVLDDNLGTLNLSGRTLIEYEHRIIEDYIDNPRTFKAITLEDFRKECVELINDSSIEFNTDNAKIIAEILNSIGMVYFDKRSDTDGIVFTEIMRLNELIKEVMDHAKKGNDKGIFKLSQVEHIDHKEDILRLLVKNNSIIPINNTDFLVPQFLPSVPDPSINFFLAAFTYTQVRFVYKAYFHKTLLLSLFTKYLSKDSPGNNNILNLPFWKNGIIIARGEESNKQMVFVQFEKTEQMGIINIKTMAPYSKTGLEHDVVKTLEELNGSWSVDKEISINGKNFFNAAKIIEEAKSGIFEFASEDKKIFTVNDFKHIVSFEKLPKRLFISYSSKNSEFVKRLITHLEVLKAAGSIDPWYDRMIESGTRWDDTIRAEMRNSDIVIFLLSPDFLATEYIMKTEVPLALAQIGKEDYRFFFIELQPCGWKKTEIGNFQQNLHNSLANKKIISIGTADNDAMWQEAVENLEKVIIALEKKRSP